MVQIGSVLTVDRGPHHIIFQFKRGYGERATFMYMLRSSAAQVFTGLAVRFHPTKNWILRREPECSRYLKWDVENATYPDDPPHLYPGFVRVRSEKFRSSWLINVSDK